MYSKTTPEEKTKGCYYFKQQFTKTFREIGAIYAK